MIKNGCFQELSLKKVVTKGFLLTDEDREVGVLLPKDELPEGFNIEEEKIEVFVYQTRSGDFSAMMNAPETIVGEVGVLKVVDVKEHGAYLSWIKDKELFLPAAEYKGEVEVGQEIIVYVDLDWENRVVATMNIYDNLSEDNDGIYKIDQQVKGFVYKIVPGIGTFVAVDKCYKGLIPEKESYQKIELGSEINLRVIRVREDGKIDVSPRQIAFKQMDVDSKKLWDELEDSGGFLPYNDKSDPMIIERRFQMSKKAFKRAIGRLLKEGRIEFHKSGFKAKEEGETQDAPKQ